LHIERELLHGNKLAVKLGESFHLDHTRIPERKVRRP
jgi:hypothetical protein